MSSETDSIRALSKETDETVILTREFYQCIVRDPRTKSGANFQAVRVPIILEEPAPVVEET
jgi:hypothetical protein